MAKTPPMDIVDDASSSTSVGDGAEEVASACSEPLEVVEPWVDWIRRVTAEVEEWNAKLSIQPWLEIVRRKKHQWAGHLARRNDERWSLRVLDWTPEGGRRQGGTGRGRKQARPRKRWEDDLQKHVDRYGGAEGVHWRLLTANRSGWKEMEDDYATGAWRSM